MIEIKAPLTNIFSAGDWTYLAPNKSFRPRKSHVLGVILWTITGTSRCFVAPLSWGCSEPSPNQGFFHSWGMQNHQQGTSFPQNSDEFMKNKSMGLTTESAESTQILASLCHQGITEMWNNLQRGGSLLSSDIPSNYGKCCYLFSN